MNLTVSQQQISQNPLSKRVIGRINYNSASDLVNYRFKLSKTNRLIFDYITSFKKKDFIKLRRKTIATAVGCSTKSVTRALALFDVDGVIAKHRPFHQSPNILTLTPQLVRGPQAFSLWMSKLSDSNKEMVFYQSAYRNLKGEIVPLKIENVPTYTKKSNNNKYIYNTTTTTTKITYISKRDESFQNQAPKRNTQKGGVGVVEKNKKRKENVVLNETSRNFLIRSQNNPNARQVLDNPEIKSALYTPLILDIQQTLKMEDREILQLMAIPEEALAHTLAIAKRMISGALPITTPIDDSFNWFIGVSLNKCKAIGETMDRPFYQALCKIMDVTPVVAGENPRPLKKNAKPRNEGGHSPAVQAPKMSDNERIGFLVKEIAAFKEKIANPEKYFLGKVRIEESLEVGRSFLAEREQELADLLNPPAKLGVNKSDKDMTPEEWLIWNRECKIQRLKEQKLCGSI
jgi:hypothetical protein